MADYAVAVYKAKNTEQKRLTITFMMHAGDEDLYAKGAQFATAFVGDGFTLDGKDIMVNDEAMTPDADRNDYIIQNDGDGVIIMDLAKLFQDKARDLDIEGVDTPVPSIELDMPYTEEATRSSRDLYIQVFYNDEAVLADCLSLKNTMTP